MKAKFVIKPLFTSTTGVIAVNGQDLKPYNYSELLSILPEDIRTLMGESLTPEDLKAKTTTDRAKVPADFQDWGLLRIPPRMKLRNRLTPASLSSVPAISLSRTNTITEALTNTTLTFSSGDGFSEFDDSVQSAHSVDTPPGALPPRQPPVQRQRPRLNQPANRNIRSLIRRNTRQDGSFIRDDFALQNDDLTEAPNLRTTEQGVRLVSRTIIPPPFIRQLPRQRPLPPPGFSQQTARYRSYSAQARRERQQRDQLLDDLNYPDRPIIEHRTRPLPVVRQIETPTRSVSGTLSPPILRPTPIRKSDTIGATEDIRPVSRSNNTLSSQDGSQSEFDPIPFAREDHTSTPPTRLDPDPRVVPIVSPSPVQQKQDKTRAETPPESPERFTPPRVISTPVYPPVQGILKRTILKDENGFPIAQDSQGRLYRIPRDFTPKAKIKIKTPSVSEQESDGSPGTAPTPRTPPQPKQKTTRSGRIVKEPDRYGDWMTGTPPEQQQTLDKDITQDQSSLPADQTTSPITETPKADSPPQTESEKEPPAGEPPANIFISPPRNKPPAQDSPTEDSFVQDVMDDYIIKSTPNPAEKPKPERSIPSGQASAFTEYSSLKDNTGSFMRDIQEPKEKSELEETALSHANDSEQDLSGIPLNIYATPENYARRTQQTTVHNETLEQDETQLPRVPQPGTARSFEAQEQMKEFLNDQDQKANEKALADSIPVSSPQQTPVKSNPPSAQTTPPNQTPKIYPDLSGLASPLPKVLNTPYSNPRPPLPTPPQQLTPQHQPSPHNQPSPHYLYPDLPMPVPPPPIPPVPEQNKKKKKQQQPPPSPPGPTRRSQRVRRPPRKYGYDEEY